MVRINGVKCIDLNYVLALDLKIDGAVLTILEGRLREVSLGSYQAEAKILINGFEIFKCPTRVWKLPGTLRSKEGIPLRRAVSR
jgi:hypothetical protein